MTAKVLATHALHAIQQRVRPNPSIEGCTKGCAFFAPLMSIVNLREDAGRRASIDIADLLY